MYINTSTHGQIYFIHPRSLSLFLSSRHRHRHTDTQTHRHTHTHCEKYCLYNIHFLSFIFTFSYPLTAGAVEAPQMTSQPVFSIFPVLHCPLGLGELQACPFPDATFTWCLKFEYLISHKTSGRPVSYTHLTLPTS